MFLFFRVVEYVDHLHEHFVHPVVIKNAHYMPPMEAGYSSEMKQDSINDYQYPGGGKWQQLFRQGLYQDPAGR